MNYLHQGHPLTFQESNESPKEEINVEKDIFEALQHAGTMGEWLEETLWGLWQNNSPPTHSYYY